MMLLPPPWLLAAHLRGTVGASACVRRQPPPCLAGALPQPALRFIIQAGIGPPGLLTFLRWEDAGIAMQATVDTDLLPREEFSLGMLAAVWCAHD